MPTRRKERALRRRPETRRDLRAGGKRPGSLAGNVVLFNKPYGVVCQFTSEGTQATLKDYLPQPDIYPAGRLDADSEGLVVLTGDGALQHRISDPRHKLPKTYWVEVEGIPSADVIDALRAGIQVKDYKTRPAEVHASEPPAWLWARVPPIRFRRNIPTSWLALRITEGRNRQVRHMTAAVGFPTLRLIRYQVGPWTIDGLQPGEWREMSTEAPSGVSTRIVAPR